MSVTQIVGPRIAPYWADPVEWTSTRAYEPFTFVTYQGDSYCSRQDIPIGIDIKNDDYWVKVSDYNAQAVALQRSMTKTIETAETNMSNTVQSAKNNLTDVINTAKADMNQSVSDVNTAINTAKADMNQSVSDVQSVKNEFQTHLDQVTNNKNDIAAVRKRATYNERPILVAHQGSATMAPNQTLAAYMAAITYGADALECDPQLTTDGILVCVHDADTSIVSNHEPILTYSNSTWSDLESVIVDKPGSAQFFEPQHLMRFDDLCALCNRYGKKIVVDDKAHLGTQGLTAYYRAIKTVLDSYNLTDNAYLLANTFDSVDAIQSVFPTSTPIFVEGAGNESNFIEARNRGIGIALNINNPDDVRLQQIYNLPADLWTLDDTLESISIPYNLLTTNNPFMFAKPVSNQNENGFTYKTSYTLPVEFSKMSYEMFGFFMYSTINAVTGIMPQHNPQQGVSELVKESDGYNHFLHCKPNESYNNYKYTVTGNIEDSGKWLDPGWKTGETYTILNNTNLVTDIKQRRFRVKMNYGNYGIAHNHGHVSVNELNLCMASMVDGEIINGPQYYCCFPNLRFPSGAISIPVLAENTRNWEYEIIDISADGSEVKRSHWNTITANGINEPASTHDRCARRFIQFRIVEHALDDADIKNLMEMLPHMFTEKELIK